MMSVGANGYVSYTHAGCGAEHGESEKRSSWEDAIDRRVVQCRRTRSSLSHSVSKREELGGRLRDVSLMIVWSWRMASAMWTCTIGRARNFPLRGMILCLSWWPKDGLKSELPHRVVTGRSVFEICSTRIMKITRWARRALVMMLDWYRLRLEYVRQCDSQCMPE